MFSLVATIISIALAAAFVVATLAYLGDSYLRQGSQVDASIMINHSSQLVAADMLHLNLKGNRIGVLGNTFDQITVEGQDCPTPGIGGCFPQSYLNSVPLPPTTSAGPGNSYLFTPDFDIAVALDGTRALETCEVVNKIAGLVDEDNNGRLDLLIDDLGQSPFGCYQEDGLPTFLYKSK